MSEASATTEAGMSARAFGSAHEGASGRGAAAQPYRRASGGTAIDRSRPVTFAFDGQAIEGFEGDTVASAMLAAGRHMVARSFKYHRPRGILAAGPEDPAGLVQVGADQVRTEPNVRVSEQEIFAGLAVRSQNRWPSLRFDIGRLNDVAHRLLPSGFYYKTFMGPPFSWRFFEGIIRAAAGLGRAPSAPDPDRYEHRNTHCDVLVVGGGAAGLAAASEAARAGAYVVLAEESPLLGGWLLSADRDAVRIDGMPASEWLAARRGELEDHPRVAILRRTTVCGYYTDNFLVGWERVTDHGDDGAHAVRQRLWRIRARQVVLATGLIEQPLLFHRNDVPGVMLASAAVTFANRYGVLAGHCIVVATNNDSGYGAALALQRAGAAVIAVVDSRESPAPELLPRMAAAGIDVRSACAVSQAFGTRRVRGVEIVGIDHAGEPVGAISRLACDCLAVSGGFAANIALFSQSRGQLRPVGAATFRPGVSWQQERSAGGANGCFGLAAALEEGCRAGAQAASEAGFAAARPAEPDVVDPEIAPGEPHRGPVAALIDRPAAFVDLQNDVTVADLVLAAREGYRSVEHAKRYTTTGMGTDQGKTVGPNALATLAAARGEDVSRLGTTTFRQPYKPLTFAALAGAHVGLHFAPRRTTPLHAEAVAAGAVFEVAGDWLRAWIYPRSGESHREALMRECRAARTAVAVVDASTLGKIDIRGRDARTFLNRVYTNAWSKLAPGRCRYGLMLGEDGMVMDDGVTSCIADDHFHMTTTTGGAAAVLAHLEDLRQTEWPDLEVFLTTVTEQWAVMSVCGPKSADVMAELTGDRAAMAPDAFAFMTWKEATIDGIAARIFRISFTGDLSYEINVPSRFAVHVWRRLMAIGAPHGITPYGTEAMHLLRAEKGFIIVGQDTDGTVTPRDLGMDWIVSGTKGDFVGKRSLARADTDRRGRKQLVGLLAADPARVLAEGAHVLYHAEEPAPPVPTLGHVTSSYHSPALGRSIALGLVRDGRSRLGETVWVSDLDGGDPVETRLTETDFLAMAERSDVVAA